MPRIKRKEKMKFCLKYILIIRYLQKTLKFYKLKKLYESEIKIMTLIT